MQVTTRDRNVMALQSDLLGAWALGVRSILALSGDPLKVGPLRGDRDARRRPRLDGTGAARRGDERGSARGRRDARRSRPAFLVASAANPLVDTVEKLEAKLDAGTHFFQSNIVYDVDRFAEWFAPIVAAGVPARAPLLVGVTPPRSTQDAPAHARQHPGESRSTRRRSRGWRGSRATRRRRPESRSRSTSSGDCARCRAWRGVHVMAPGWEAEAVPRVVEGAGLGTAV